MKEVLDNGLTYEKIVTAATENYEEYYYKIRNNTDRDVFLDKFVMFECDSLESLGLHKDSRLFRSGRHKNDMPGVCTLGVMDEAMKDLMSVMSEVGDKQDGAGNVIVSDHITVLGKDKNYVAISYTTGRSQMFSTNIYVDSDGNFKKIESQVEFYVRLVKGAERVTETIRIEHTDSAQSAIEAFAVNKAELYNARKKKKLSIFCTWYYYGLTVTYEDVKTNLEIMKKKQIPFDVFQIDEGWEKVLGEWEPNSKFPVPMKEIAEEIKAAGYIPGIWTSPFVAHETSGVWKKHPDWILKDKNGQPCLFPMNDTVYYIFDITNSATWDYFYELYRRLTFDWGYTYHKLDFTRAAVIVPDAVYYDDTITLTESYVKAVEAIRRGMGENSFFLMCGGLYDPIIGLVDAQRTGSDVLSMWSSNINKDGKTAPYTIKQSLMRYYMNYWWSNDPDALMVRKNEVMERNLRLTYGLLNDDEVKTSVINQFMGAGIISSTEPLDKIDDTRLYELRRVIPVLPMKIRPVNIMESGRFPENIVIECADADGNYSSESILIARTNWSDDEEKEIYITPGKFGICADELVVCEYYNGKVITKVKPGDTVSVGVLKPHASTIIKIESVAGDPIVVESNGHLSMGKELEVLEIVENELRIAGRNKFDYPVEYVVMVPGCYFIDKEARRIRFKMAGLECFDKKVNLRE